jgi:bifunctional polynucleotide phosphatase/kinase
LGVDPKALRVFKNDSTSTVKVSGRQEMVVFVGWPASGKSSLYRNKFAPKGYVHINRDIIGTTEKCFKETKRAIEAGKSVAIDNTNPAASDREPYVELAKSKNISIRCIRMGTSREVAVHNNYFRVKETDGAVRRIPAVAYNMFNKKLEEPVVAEGFNRVEVVPFVTDFADEGKKLLYLERVEKA